VLEPLATLNVASGGLAPREVIEVAVNPAGFPSAPHRVITDTPEACNLKLARNASVASFSKAKFSITLILIFELSKATF
jgi:hypothetical protein